jgi:DNA polymerase-3 subunit alpha
MGGRIVAPGRLQARRGGVRIQHQHKGHVHRIDQEAFSGMRPDPAKYFRPLRRDLADNPAQQRLKRKQRQRRQRQARPGGRLRSCRRMGRRGPGIGDHAPRIPSREAAGFDLSQLRRAFGSSSSESGEAYGGKPADRVKSPHDRVKKLPGLCQKLGFPAIAVTDTNNLFGGLEFSENCAKAGVQPIMGLQLAVAYADSAHEANPGEKPVEPAPIALYAQDEAGWLNLMALSSSAFLDTDTTQLPHVTLDALAGHSDGVICLTGGAGGPLGKLLQANRRPAAEALAKRLSRMFPNRLYIEIQRHGSGGPLRTPPEEASEPGLIDIAHTQNLPLVATNDVYFETPEMFQAHDAFLCIGESRYVNESNRRQLTPEHYLKTGAEMAARFEDLPEAIANTIEIARRCAFRPRTHEPILPRFADDEVDELKRESREGLKARLEVIPHAAPVAEYEKRLEFELGVIEQMGFPGYFLIVADFIKWAKSHDIPVGPGRGSGAGSLVAYALTITDLDPLRYGLLFERFLNPERISMPDFDIDFCQDRREEVINYVQQKYGRDRVAQIITFGTLLSKMAVRDVARVLQMSYSQGDRLSKLIPVEGVKPLSIKQARKEEPRLEEEARRDENVATLLDIAEKIEGLLRNASTHAAGVVIGDRPLAQLVPLYRDPRSEMPATQYNMKWVEPAGLVKFDFLGLKTLTVIQNAVELLKLRGVEVDISTIPLDDPATYELYSRADTIGVFQVESQGMRDALRQLHPTCIEDIVALVALYRPGPMENIPKFCNVKNGREERESLHPSIDPILDETQGIIVYQEQGAGDGDRPQDGGLQPRRRRPSAPRHGQEDPGGDGRGEAEIPGGRLRERRADEEGAAGLGPAGQVRQLRLQQIPRRRLRRGQLPDRLAEGELPGRVHGRGDES